MIAATENSNTSVLRQTRCTAFEGSKCIVSGKLADVASMAKEVIDKNQDAQILIFDDITGELIEVDFRGTVEDVLNRLVETTNQELLDSPSLPSKSEPARGPGRPKLGVVAREVTLLPRHWVWLNDQPGGASVALRKLVEEAKRANAAKDQVRHSREACYRFIFAMAGNLPGFEEATRALFAGDQKRFDENVQSWPVDIRTHATRLATVAS